MKQILALMLSAIISLHVHAKEHAILDGKYSITFPDDYVVKVTPQGDNITAIVARSGRNPLSGINIVIHHADILDNNEFNKNADAYFASLRKGLKEFEKPKEVEGDIPRLMARGTIEYKDVSYSMDAFACRYKHAVFYNILYKGEEDKKLLSEVLSTFQQKR